MPKREHSPGPLPLAKRAHTISPNVHVHRDHRGSSSFDSYFYDELILVIFSYLSWADLCVIRPTNSNWCRLSPDNQVLISNNMLPDNSGTDSELHLNSSGNLYTLANMERSGRTRTHHDSDDAIRDWKWMFRIGSNWRTGMSSVNVFTFSTLTYIPSGRCSINSLTFPHSMPSIS